VAQGDVAAAATLDETSQEFLKSLAALYGWDGADLSRLLVESAANPNLRVTPYVGPDRWVNNTEVTLLASAVWFWRSVLARESSPIDSLAFIVAGFMQMGLLGALLTFAPEPLFAAHLFAPLAYGVAPLDDQALGGLIMWVPASIPFAVAAAFVARRGFALVASQGAARC